MPGEAMEALEEAIQIETVGGTALRMDDLHDNELMVLVKAGDLDKLGILFERYKTRLYRYFYLNTGDQDASEDLVQNVFMRIIRFRDRFEAAGEFRSWMFSIAYHAKIDHFRKGKRTQRHEELRETDAVLERTAEHDMIDSENVSRLESALQRLRDDYREVLILARYEELKYREIAEMLGCSEGAVKVRIHRALQELKGIFDRLE
jgi:RNA polymerase sigma factor (sigma-70 family)